MGFALRSLGKRDAEGGHFESSFMCSLGKFLLPHCSSSSQIQKVCLVSKGMLKGQLGQLSHCDFLETKENGMRGYQRGGPKAFSAAVLTQSHSPWAGQGALG